MLFYTLSHHFIFFYMFIIFDIYSCFYSYAIFLPLSHLILIFLFYKNLLIKHIVYSVIPAKLNCRQLTILSICICIGRNTKIASTVAVEVMCIASVMAKQSCLYILFSFACAILCWSLVHYTLYPYVIVYLMAAILDFNKGRLFLTSNIK